MPQRFCCGFSVFILYPIFSFCRYLCNYGNI
nr:MAG TPA: 4Fe-4S binding domain protein [Caudoviricetes sp.]DAV12531.1 MAG TPA: 4Fe-4S binding domain protein [Bacteriophage sp.]